LVTVPAVSMMSSTITTCRPATEPAISSAEETLCRVGSRLLYTNATEASRNRAYRSARFTPPASGDSTVVGPSSFSDRYSVMIGNAVSESNGLWMNPWS
jgi:hypothetical protein